MLRRIALLLTGVLLLCTLSFAQERTKINDKAAGNKLLGRHMLSLQWISWDYFGRVNVTNKGGVYYLKGEQKGRGNTDFVRVEGVITRIDAKEFWFDGKVTTQVSHINDGMPCVRDGEDIVFRITGKRKYWRMTEIDNPCDAVADYVDIYFR
ncbi:MAG: hypothetical protein WBD16_00530 [Pyrinomonadaceae bacterium]